MAGQIDLNNVRVQIWPHEVGTYMRQYTDLQLSYMFENGCLFIKQYSELMDTHSFVYYKFVPSSFCYLSTERLSHDETVISIRLIECVTATISTDPTCSDDFQERITLEMSCTLIETSIPAASKLNIIVPDVSRVSEDIRQLVETLEVCSSWDLSTRNTSLSTTKSILMPHPISFTQEELDLLFSRGGNYKSSSVEADHNSNGMFGKRNGDIISTQSQASTLSHNDRQTERIRHSNWADNNVFWAKEFGVNPGPQPGSMQYKPTVQVRAQTQTYGRDAWVIFAVSNGGEGGRVQPSTTQPTQILPALQAAKNATPGTVVIEGNLEMIDNGGYCKGAYRDHGKTGGSSGKQQTSQQRLDSAKRRARLPRHAKATFIPPTQNSPADRPKWEDELPLNMNQKW